MYFLGHFRLSIHSYLLQLSYNTIYLRRVTVTSKVHDAMLFEASANMYITVVEPTLNICPDECVFTIRVTLSDSSTAVGSVQDTMAAEYVLSFISEVISDEGQFTIVGGIASFS